MCSDNCRSVIESCVSDIIFQRSESTPQSVTLFNTTNDQLDVDMLESLQLLIYQNEASRVLFERVSLVSDSYYCLRSIYELCTINVTSDNRSDFAFC